MLSARLTSRRPRISALAATRRASKPKHGDISTGTTAIHLLDVADFETPPPLHAASLNGLSQFAKEVTLPIDNVVAPRVHFVAAC